MEKMVDIPEPETVYYAGEVDDFDVFANPDGIIGGEPEYEPKADLRKWTTQAPPDPEFDKEMLEQATILKQREDRLEKTTQPLDKRAEIKKSEQAEKQRLHHINLEEKKRYILYKNGPRWDEAKRQKSTPQLSTNNDKQFLTILRRYKEVNP